MSKPRQKFVVFLTAFAFLYPLIADAMEIGHTENGGAAGVHQVHGVSIGDSGQTLQAFDRAVYAADRHSDSDTNDLPNAPVTDHRHCGSNLAGCVTMMMEWHRAAACQRHSCSVKPSQRFMTGFIPTYILPPPKRPIKGTA